MSKTLCICKAAVAVFLSVRSAPRKTQEIAVAHATLLSSQLSVVSSSSSRQQQSWESKLNSASGTENRLSSANKWVAESSSLSLMIDLEARFWPALRACICRLTFRRALVPASCRYARSASPCAVTLRALHWLHRHTAHYTTVRRHERRIGLEPSSDVFSSQSS